MIIMTLKIPTRKSLKIFYIIDFTAAKMKELQSWISNKVYDVVSKTTNKYISIRWVLTTKQTPNGIIPKAWLIARGLKKDCLTKPEKESPTCSKGSIRTLLSICAQNYGKLHSIVIKTAFLQGNLLTRDIFINPPPEASCPSTCTWKLNKCICGLCGVSLKWYSRVCDFVTENNEKVLKLDPALFMWHDENNEIIRLIAAHPEDFLCTCKSLFLETILEKLWKSFSIGNEEQCFYFLGSNIKLWNNEILLD